MRLFISIPLEDDPRRLVTDVQNTFRRQNVRGNYTPEENLHITLAFLGEYNDPDAVLAAMGKLRFSPFTLTMDHVGCFGDLWWAGLAESGPLEALARNLRRALAEAKIPFDKKRFRPHVTFLRRSEADQAGAYDCERYFADAVHTGQERYDLYRTRVCCRGLTDRQNSRSLFGSGAAIRSCGLTFMVKWWIIET